MNYIALSLALLALPTVSHASQEPVHNPRTSPTRLRHALFAIPGVSGPVVPVGDVNGDGTDDLVVETIGAITLHSGRDGTELRVLVRLQLFAQYSAEWAVGPDIDGDGIRDLAVIGGAESALALELRSGRTGDRIHTPPAPAERPRAVLWLDDVDGDGLDDLVLADAESREVMLLSSATWGKIWRAQLAVPEFGHVRLQNLSDQTADGVDDLLVESWAAVSRDRLMIGPDRRVLRISGKDGALLESEFVTGGYVIALGDIDGDGLGDVASDTRGWGGGSRSRFVIETTQGSLAWSGRRYPNTFTTSSIIQSVGDIDGDGVADIGVGDVAFEFLEADRSTDLSNLTLVQAFELGSPNREWKKYESGCAWILSGRTGAGIMGVWGEPGTGFAREAGGVGRDVFGVSDQDGDGWRDIAVLAAEGAYIFSTGPPAESSDDPFVWMPGRWVSRTTRGSATHISEEVWRDVGAGRMPGISRSYVEGSEAGASFEYLRIERMPEELTLIAQPGGGEETRFTATEFGPGWVLFTNPDHDFPTRLLYRRTGDELTADVGTEEKPESLRFRWSLVTLVAPVAIPERVYDPRTCPTRIEHALFKIPNVTGPVVSVGDLDDDGIDDLIVQEGLALTLHSGRDGVEIRTLAEVAVDVEHGGPSWSVGADVDADGIGDLALIVASESGPTIELLSTRTGAAIHSTLAPAGTACAVVWLDDVDGDGVGDLAFADATGFEVVLVSGATWLEIWRTQFPETSSRSLSLQNLGDRTGDGVDDVLLGLGSIWNPVREEWHRGEQIWISGSDGAIYVDELNDPERYHARHVLAIGDIDGDDLGDVLSSGIELKSTAGPHTWTLLRHPDPFRYDPIVRPVGDIDGDGVPDIGVGEANFNLRGDGEVLPETRAVDLSKMTLDEAFATVSKPSSVSWESGCAWILSGRTGSLIMGVWGEPGSGSAGTGSAGGRGMVGTDVFGVGDQDGDGWRDVAVLAGGTAYFFSTGPTVVLSDDPFVWMPGRWASRTTRNNFTRVSEETWLEAGAGLMPGISRSYTEGARNGGTFEYMRIVRTPDALTLIAQPGGGDATRFEATEVGPGWVLFTNPEHDFPTQILYRRKGDELSADVGTTDKPDALRLRWSLAKGD